MTLLKFTSISECLSTCQSLEDKDRVTLCLALYLLLGLLVVHTNADSSRLTTTETKNVDSLTIEMSSGKLLSPSSEQDLSIQDDFSGVPNSGFSDEPSKRLTAETEDSQGLNIDRLTPIHEGEFGTLRWSPYRTSFNEYLPELEHLDLERDNQNIESKFYWLTPNGFSVALESTASSAFSRVGQAEMNDQVDDSTSVVLSWLPDQNGNAGDYRISAIGARLNLSSGRTGLIGNSATSWGLNLQGNWQIGDLVAALSVTYGKGIDSYVLRRNGKDLFVMVNRADNLSATYELQPSLYYTLNDKSKFHMVLGRQLTEIDGSNSENIDQTIDTLHLEYTWSPWPKTEFGLAISKQDIDHDQSNESSSVITLEGSKKF